MKAFTIFRKIKKLIEIPILKKNIELVDLEWKRERGAWVLRLFIDKPGGVTIGDCAKISELVGKILDKEDIIHRSYILEVSSPGIERPLVKKEDYERFKGEKVKIRNPLATRPWQHVLEPLSGYLILAEKLYKNQNIIYAVPNFYKTIKRR